MCQKTVIIVILLLVLSLSMTSAQDAWMARDSAERNVPVRAALFNSGALYIATKNALYKTTDIKEKWESIFSLPSGGTNEIRCLAGRQKVIFIGTRRGLFRSDDLGQRWKNVFKTILPDKNNITCMELSRYNRLRLVIATEKGIFSSDDLGAKWHDISGILKNASVKCLALNKESLYAGTDSGLYIRKTDPGDWERIFIRSPAAKTETEEPLESIEYDIEKDMPIGAIAIDGARVYISYGKNIVYSDDEGRNWENLQSEGLSRAINYILISAKNKRIYCATEKGVFEFDAANRRWLELYKGMAKSVRVNRLIFSGDDENIIFAATDKGLYSFQSGEYMMDKYPDIEKSMNIIKAAFTGEPSYKELQQAAIKFCDVSPEKIRSWHRESRIKAIVPKISFGLDNHRSTNSEIYTSATKDYISIGPDNVYDALSLSVSWDLGNLIWSDDQTNIDVRSRLTTQLRNDILDDLRRSYYERKRLLFELMTNPPHDTNLKLNKELRLQELTQAIDDLTGNYFSEHIRKQETKRTK